MAELPSGLWPVICSPWVQAAALVGGTLVVYRYAFFDVARADQLIYLYRTVDIHGLWNLTVGAYDFNRTHSVGDFVLFRPVLYMLLGLERWLWGYNFLAWQATSIALHISVILSLYWYFRYICNRVIPPDRTSFAPFILALFFAFLYAGTELVAWHHIVGYLLFCLLSVQALFAYQRFLDRRDACNAALIVLFRGVACFTYELGNVLAGLLGLSLLVDAVLERWTGKAAPIANQAFWIVGAVLLLLLPVIYVSCSYLNYIVVLGAVPYLPPLSNPDLIRLALKSIGSWTLSTFVPGSYPLVPGGRIHGHPADHIPGIPAEIACAALVCAILLCGKRKTYLDILRNGLPALMATLLGITFAVIISIGRVAERGEEYVLQTNTYYCYIFALFLLLGFFHSAVAPAAAEPGQATARIRGIMLAANGTVALIAGARVYRLHEVMYKTYSGPIGRLIRQIELLEALHRGESNFSFSLGPDCGGIFVIPWFSAQALEKRQRYTIASALFPHEERDAGGKYTVHCP